MMRIYQETTLWEDQTPNHQYILSDDMRSCIGYIQRGFKEPKMFSKPMYFDPRYRTFKMVREYKEYDQYIGHGDYQTIKEYKVAGSKGAEYTVTISEVSGDKCTCPGFTFRGKCKHIAEVLKGNE